MGDDPRFIQIGPAGSRRSNVTSAWDDKGRDQLVQIFICHSNCCIHWIQFQYVENGTRVMSERHGCTYAPNSSKFNVVNLKYPEEYVTWISGYFYFGDLASLTIGTNCGQYGPFGGTKGLTDDFRFELGETRQFGGFHGTENSGGVKSIGVYLKPNTEELRVVKLEKKTIR